MSGSTEHQAYDAGEKPERGEVALSLRTVQKMLPLVRRIVDDILLSQKTLRRLHPEENKLNRQRRTLDWPERQRRYRLKEEVVGAEQGLLAAMEELGSLGVVLLDAVSGRVGFPTMVNNRRAYFSWHPGEEGLHSWQFAEENVCRPIPPAWLKELSFSGKS